MDVRINEVESKVQVGDSPTLLDPRVMKEIIRACVKAVKEDQEREKKFDKERKLSSSTSSRT